MNKAKRKAHKRKCKRHIAAVNKKWNERTERRRKSVFGTMLNDDIPF